MVKPIPSEVEIDADPVFSYTAKNRMAAIVYELRSRRSELLLQISKPIKLSRVYDSTKPTTTSDSIYEFKHDFIPSGCEGRCTLSTQGIDSAGAAVAGTEQEVVIYAE